MENSGWFVLLGAIISFVPTLIVEKVKEHSERKAVAQAFAGEISATLDMVKRRNYLAHFTVALQQAEKNIAISSIQFDIGLQKNAEDPIFENYISKLGLLRKNLPRDIVQFYSQLKGIKIDLIRLAEGKFPTAPEQAFILNDDIKLWKKTEVLAQGIINQLDQASKIHVFIRHLDLRWICPLLIAVSLVVCTPLLGGYETDIKKQMARCEIEAMKLSKPISRVDYADYISACMEINDYEFSTSRCGVDPIISVEAQTVQNCYLPLGIISRFFVEQERNYYENKDPILRQLKEAMQKPK